jgi:Ni/Co efflux regulator RcnB
MITSRILITATAAFALATAAALAQEARFSDHDQQVTRDWYNQHKDHRPAGLRDSDRLPANEESHLREGETLDKNLRRKVHPAPPDLARQLPPPPPEHRYVAIGGHVGLIDKNYNVKAVVRLHD